MLFALLVLGLVSPRFQAAALGLSGLPPEAHPYIDAQVIVAGAQSRSEGLDPLRENPHDPFARLCNYPRIVAATADLLGLHVGHGAALGAFFGITALVAFAVLWSHTLPACRSTLAVALISPPVWLLLERGNLDGLLLGLIIIPALYGGAGAASAALVACCLIKLYPCFGCAALLGDRLHTRLWLVAGAICAAYGTWLWLAGDLALIRAATPHQSNLSWGAGTLGLSLARHFTLPWIGHLAGGLALLSGAVIGWRKPFPQAEYGCPPLRLAAACAAIFCGAYFLGANFDYRLVFLLPIFPALSTHPSGRGAALALLACLWGSMSANFTAPSGSPIPGLWLLKQATVLLALAVCAAVLAASCCAGADRRDVTLSNPSP